MTALLLHARRGGLRGRHPGLDRPARARPHDPGEEVRREGHAVLHRLRPDRVEQAGGETEYGVKAIPLGGYVKIVGMLPPGADGPRRRGRPTTPQGNQVVKVRKSNTGMFTQLISDARAAEWEHDHGPSDADRLFYKMPWWKKVIVMAGGPTVNLAHRVLHLLGRLRHLRQPERRRRRARRSSTRSQACVVPVRRGRPRLPAPTTRSPRPSRPACRPGDRDRRLQRHRGSPTGTSCSELIRANDDGAAVDRLRARRPAS